MTVKDQVSALSANLAGVRLEAALVPVAPGPLARRELPPAPLRVQHVAGDLRRYFGGREKRRQSVHHAEHSAGYKAKHGLVHCRSSLS